MTLRAITITHTDTAWHGAFVRFVSSIFPSISFQRWQQLGGWDERYTVFALADGDRIVASASLTRMQIVLNDVRIRGWQLGSVGTVPELRGRGLQRQILPRLLAQADANDLVFLFANHQVLDFYPRFSFRRVRECLFEAPAPTTPQGTPLRALNLESAEDRALLQRISAAAQPVTTLFGVENYGQVALWYWCNFYRDAFRYAPDSDAIFVVQQSHDSLRVYDVLSAGPVDLKSHLPQLITAPINRLEFGFTPTRHWPSATSMADYTDSPLFVRGPRQLPEQPFKFPMLAQT